jgi:hypothetical protein
MYMLARSAEYASIGGNKTGGFGQVRTQQRLKGQDQD